MTTVVVTVEARLVRTPDGAVWSCGPPARSFWDRYLAVFNQVRVVARVRHAEARPPGAVRVDGDSVTVWPVPYYVGAWQYLLRRREVARAVLAGVGADDAVVLRVPSVIGTLVASDLRRSGRPYALEVVGDPLGVFAPGVLRHPLRPLLRRWYTSQLRHQCRSAAAVAYITDRYLQEQYRPGPRTHTTSYSSVDLPASAYVAAPRTGPVTRDGLTLVSVGSLEQLYKGIDSLIEAIALLTRQGMPVRLVHVGEGRFRDRLARLAARRKVADQVVFRGALPPGEAVRAEFDAADLFVMPSRTEGQGRALIEAMARAMPAIGSTAGGIPELLPAECLVAPDDVVGLAAKVRRMLMDPGWQAAASARNLRRARDFSAAVLAERRTAYYRLVHEMSRAATGRQPTSGRSGG